MAPVPKTTLAWLYGVLGKSYRDPNRTYSDCVQALSQYPGLAPRSDVYTFENGSSALLVRFVGTIPVLFRGATYNFPISLWMSYGYPREAPLVYVAPTEQMAVRPGQHVSGDGRVYHHYLARWADAWERSSLIELLSVLSDVFAREPPVVSKHQILPRPPVQQAPEPPPPPVPPLPQELQRPPSQTAPSSAPPPLPPPKESAASRNGIPPPEPQRPSAYDTPSSWSLQPGAANDFRSISGPSYLQARQSTSSQYLPARNSSLRQSMSPQQAPDYPGSQQYPQGQGTERTTSIPPPEATVGPPQLPAPAAQSNDHYRQPAQQQPVQQHFRPAGQPAQPTQYPPHITQQNSPYPPGQQYYPPQQPSSQPTYQPLQQQHLPPAQETKPKPRPPPPPNLLDSPFDISLPVSTSNLPAPPIPRNPEKDALLSTLSTTLTKNLHAAISQNSSAMPHLQSQHSALETAQHTLSSELDALTKLSSTLSSNISILQSALHSSNAAIAAAQSRAAKGDIPNVDEMLTAPTVVGKQLYDVMCEERGIEAGIWALQEGFVRGRVSLEVWARKTRELSREGFRRRWLADKIGSGMGLEA